MKMRTRQSRTFVSFIACLINVAYSNFNLESLHNESCFKTQDLSGSNVDLTPNLLSFRFFSNETHSQLFHIPKCIFNSKLTEYLFDHLSIYNDVEKYKQKFESFYMASVQGTYKTIIIEGINKTPYLDQSKVFDPEKKEEDNIITYDGKRYMNPSPTLTLIDDPPCEVFSDFNEQLLPYFGRCREFYLNFNGVKLTGHLTSGFVTIEYTATNGTNSYTIRLFFGNSREVVHAMPFEPQDLALRMMIHDDFEVMGLVENVKWMLKFFDLNSLDNLFKENHEDVTNDLRHMFSSLYSHVQKILQGSIDTSNLMIEHLLEPILSYSIGLYVQNRYPYNGDWRGVEHVINTETLLHLAPELLDIFANNMTVKNPIRPNATHLIDSLLRIYLYTTSSQTSFNHMGLSLYFLKFIYQNNVTDDIATYAYNYMTKLYGKYTYPQNLQDEDMYKSYEDVTDLFIMNTLAIKSDNKTFKNHILLLQTGLCNIKTILGHFHSLKNNNPTSLGSLVSPCFRALRYDLTAAKIGDLITTEPLQPYGRLFDMVHFMTKNYSMLNVIDCELPEDGLLAMIPIEDKLYAISSKPIATGTVYKATYTAISLSLYVTRIRNNTCIHLDKVFEKEDPKAVHSLSIDSSKDCGNVCPSVLIEYGGNTGFTGIYIINTVNDLEYISKNRQLFPLESHYIWIFKNDTVLELEGTNLFIFSSKSPGAIVLYIIITSLILWTLYEIIKLCCYRRQWQYQKL
ncbi:envelope glycoprotein H [Elephant endotheliotropic herpesvirus 5B]|nr:envelope glycoprotein H [Elephant endotheliotropic herpesvirus 5B]